MKNAIQGFFDYACKIAIDDYVVAVMLLLTNKADFANNVAFPFGKKYSELKEECRKAIREKYSVQTISTVELMNLLAEFSAKQFHEKSDQAQSFIDELESASLTEIIHFEPNFAVELADGIDRFDIGPVGVIRSTIIQNSYFEYLSNTSVAIGDSNYGLELLPSKDSSRDFTLPKFSFVFTLQCSQRRARYLSKLYAEIALSLLRLCMAHAQVAYGLTPDAGDLDPLLFSQRIGKEQGLSINLSHKDNLTAKYTNYLIYTVTRDAQRKLGETDFEAICLKIYKGNSDLLQRVKYALSWMTKARCSTDMPSRFLFFFTALEAFLSYKDKKASLSDIIARNISTLLVKAEIRCDLHKKVKTLYDTRSRIVHNGSIEVQESDCDALQFFAELSCITVIKEYLDMDLKTFREHLRKASSKTYS